MTNAELLAKIKAEIERRTKELDEQIVDIYDSKAVLRKDELQKLLSFLDTLESEKPMDQEELEEELNRFIASGKSVTVDDYGTYKVSYHDFKKVARHFAEWQKAKDDRYVDTIYQQGIEKGKDDMKEQMMKEAVDGSVEWHDFYRLDYNEGQFLETIFNHRIDDGDKVKIIIIKENVK